MRHTFESLGYQSGFYLSHLFSSTRNNPSSSSSSSSSSTTTSAAVTAIHPPPPPINWHHHRPPFLPSATTTSINLSSTLGLSNTLLSHQPKDQTHLFLHNTHHPSDQPPPVVGAHANDDDDDLKWQNRLSFFNVATTASEFQKQESNMDKFKGSFALPSRIIMASSSSSSSSPLMDVRQHHHHHHQQQEQPVDYGKSEGGPPGCDGDLFGINMEEARGGKEKGW